MTRNSHDIHHNMQTQREKTNASSYECRTVRAIPFRCVGAETGGLGAEVGGDLTVFIAVKGEPEHRGESDGAGEVERSR